MSKGKKKSELIQGLQVTDAVAEGKCIARVDDKVVFVQGAAPGDVADVRIFKKRRRYSEGIIEKLITPSPYRQEPFCEHFGVCGGCKWQHLQYEHQLHFKQKQVEDHFERIGKLEFPEISPIIGSEKTTFYRNKLEFTFSNKRWLTNEQVASGENFDRNALGFHVPGRFDKVLDVNKCWLQSDISNEIRNSLRDYCKENNLPFFDLREQVGLMRNIIIRSSATGLMVIVIFFEKSPENEKVLKFLGDKFPEITSLLYVINGKKNDTIFDLPVHLYKGGNCIYEEMEGLKFKVAPKSFYQTNSEQAYTLYKVVREFAEPQEGDIIYDLYTGTGTIALFMAKSVEKVIGVEYIQEAVDAAHENARNNGITNTNFYAGDMKDVLNMEFVEKHGRPTLLVTDPPRAGMHEDVIKTIREIKANRIVYVSCNPATQARDLALLDDLYRVKKVQPVDMFPHTHHVENVVLLEIRE